MISRVFAALIPKGTRVTMDQREIYRKALKLACSEMSDRDAVGELRSIVGIVGERMARQSLSELGDGREEYMTDRAYRLLEAAVDGEPVEAPPAELAGLFAREDALGRLPIGLAVERLTELEPRLKDVWPADVPDGGEASWSNDAPRAVKELLGPRMENPDPLVRSNLALSIASHFLALDKEGANPRDSETSYFSANRRRVVKRLF
jgi:hypothetical protein